MTREIKRDIAAWWPDLPEAVRGELATHLDREPLSADAVVAITHARGFGPAGVSFVEAGAVEHPRFFLEHQDYEWISAQRGQLRDTAAFDAAFPDDPGAIDRAIRADGDAFNRQFPPPSEGIDKIGF